jgi:hypothetical protein
MRQFWKVDTMNKREWMLQYTLARATLLNYDIESVVRVSGSLYDAICAATPETAQEGAWVEHDGDVSKAPEEGREVEAVDRDGETYRSLAEDFDWDHTNHGLDIMRWRYA